MIVCQRREFHQDLSYNAHTGLSDVSEGQCVEVPDDSPDIPAEFHHGRAALGQRGHAALLPFLVQRVGAAGLRLVGAGGVEHPHENVAVDYALHGLGQKGQGDGKARVGLHAVGVDRDHGDLGHARLLKGAADEADVVGRTAAAAGLAHEHGCMV